MSHRPRVLIELGAELDRAARAPAARRLPARPPGALSAALAIGIAVVVAATAVLTLGHHERPATTQVAPAGRAASRSLEASFAALRRPATAADRLPHAVLAAIASHKHRPFPVAGLELERSRRVISTRYQQTWLIPGRHWVCELDVFSGPRVPANIGFGIGCGSVAFTETDGIVSSLDRTRGGRTSIANGFAAILPDGTSPVRLTFRGGGAINVVENRDGVVLYRPRGVISSYAFTGPTGVRVDRRVVAAPR